MPRKKSSRRALGDENERKGLGDELLACLAQTFERIETHPEAWPLLRGKFPVPVRSARVKRFPFRVVFVELPDRLRVVALAHTSRSPGYWRERLDRPPA